MPRSRRVPAGLSTLHVPASTQTCRLESPASRVLPSGVVRCEVSAWLDLHSCPGLELTSSLAHRSMYLSARNQQPIIRHELRLWTFEEPAFALRPPPTIVSSFSTSTVDMNNLDESKHPQPPDLSSLQAHRKSSAAAIPDWDGALVPAPPPAASSRTSLDSTSSSGPVFGPTCFLPHPKIVRRHQQISIQGLVVASVWTAAWIVLCLVVPSPSRS